MVDIYVCCSMMHVLQRTAIPEKTLNIISVSFERLVVLCTLCVSIPKEIIEKVFPVTCHHKLSQQLNTASKNTFNFCILLYYYTNLCWPNWIKSNFFIFLVQLSANLRGIHLPKASGQNAEKQHKN